MKIPTKFHLCMYVYTKLRAIVLLYLNFAGHRDLKFSMRHVRALFIGEDCLRQLGGIRFKHRVVAWRYLM